MKRTPIKRYPFSVNCAICGVDLQGELVEDIMENHVRDRSGNRKYIELFHRRCPRDPVAN